ncbi:hypothetical protein B7494_g5763 [Chlorociboria aeruginascens]|nr:hypothetical protein B7494_g5763 [Chlorociboria aeruginascens]
MPEGETDAASESLLRVSMRVEKEGSIEAANKLIEDFAATEANKDQHPDLSDDLDLLNYRLLRIRNGVWPMLESAFQEINSEKRESHEPAEDAIKAFLKPLRRSARVSEMKLDCSSKTIQSEAADPAVDDIFRLPKSYFKE